MNANIFILCWILGGLINIPILALLRKKFNRVRTHDIVEEISNCLKLGPFLLVGIFLAAIDITKDEKKAKIKKKRARILKAEKKTELLRIEANLIKNRFEILDL